MYLSDVQEGGHFELEGSLAHPGDVYQLSIWKYENEAYRSLSRRGIFRSHQYIRWVEQYKQMRSLGNHLLVDKNRRVKDIGRYCLKEKQYLMGRQKKKELKNEDRKLQGNPDICTEETERYLECIWHKGRDFFRVKKPCAYLCLITLLYETLFAH